MDRWITDWERGKPDWMPYYTRANAGETLPDPASPLGVDVRMGTGVRARLGPGHGIDGNLPRG